MDEVGRRRHVAEIASGAPVLQFWHEHGAQWAKEEASAEDRARILEIAEKLKGAADERATAIAVSELKAVWAGGFPSGSDAFGWDEMNDRLPDAALLAFVRGAASV